MTVIAYDGVTLAADSRAIVGSYNIKQGEAQKLFRVGDCLYGISGRLLIGIKFLAWVGASSDPERSPFSDKDDDYCRVLEVHPDGSARIYENDVTSIPVSVPCAIGGGEQEAAVAMHCGKTAAEAVEVACLFDASCGLPVQTMRRADAAQDA